MSLELGSQAASEASFLGLVRRSFAKPTSEAVLQLKDQYAIVTGSNTGIGLAAARHLLGFGVAHLIMGVRSQARGDAAAAKLRAEFPAQTVSVWIVDMESYESVQQFAARCATLPRLDIVILNAALAKPTFTTAPSGHECMLQVNYLSTALLSILLLPFLRTQKQAGRSPVLSLVGSDIAYRTPFDPTGPVLERIDNPKDFGQALYYGISKLMLQLFVWKLCEVVDDEVVIHLVNPGMTEGTSFFDKQSWVMRMFFSMVHFLMNARSPEYAATTYIDAIARGRETHGSFLSEWRIKPFPTVCYTPEGMKLRERLWEETMEEFNFANASAILKDLKKK